MCFRRPFPPLVAKTTLLGQVNSTPGSSFTIGSGVYPPLRLGLPLHKRSFRDSCCCFFFAFPVLTTTINALTMLRIGFPCLSSALRALVCPTESFSLLLLCPPGDSRFYQNNFFFLIGRPSSSRHWRSGRTRAVSLSRRGFAWTPSIPSTSRGRSPICTGEVTVWQRERSG
jgi:hypothetical protein